MKTKNYIQILFSVCLFWSCSQGKPDNTFYIVQGAAVDQVEKQTVVDLKMDIEKVSSASVTILLETETLPSDGTLIIVGTPKSNKLLATLVASHNIRLSTAIPGPRGGIWTQAKLPTGQTAIILGGSDVQGLQYTVYDYAEEILGVDPLAYWTGKEPSNTGALDLFNFENRTIAPPKVPILCYFENDVDELASYRGKLLEYDWESFTEMVNSLVRLRYNAIHFFDMMGRPEFFIRPEYIDLNPDYKMDISYLEKMMDYVHSKGMKIQVDFGLGYQFYDFPEEKASCWSSYKDDWIAAWRYYLEKTPLAKTDIFSLRPRNQVWDWEYESTCGEDKIQVFNEVYKAFGDVVSAHNPNAIKVLICYADGMRMFNEGLSPPKDWLVAWSDDGFGSFKFKPEDTKGFGFGTYMHAGFWLNHTVHNPYPERVATVMKGMFNDYDADKYCMVNGQNFRPYLLNLEAYSEVCRDPENFDGAEFYKSWTSHYFGKVAAPYAINSMKNLHKAQEGHAGYVQHLWEIREAVSYLSNAPIERPGKSPVPYEYRRVANDLENVRATKALIAMALDEAKKGLDVLEGDKDFYYSYIYLPAQLYSDLIAFETSLHQMSKLKKAFEASGDPANLKEALVLLKDAGTGLDQIYANRLAGDKNIKWDRWYDPAIRRPNNGFPTNEMLEAISQNLNLLLNKTK
ncbi:glycosyl hydrolase 115 family protein [Spongiimicrobium sp. 3-5]|uniref:glycosyl hydrolase 115 family protein n=1 Tax=Spongiimicrobium sp. 3-5 TaxID=3332596 RepID=UPI00397FE515